MTDRWDDTFESTLRQSLPFLAAGAPLAPDASLRDLGLDSVQAVGVLIAIENAYDIEFPDELLTEDTFATPGNLWQAISGLRTVANPG